MDEVQDIYKSSYWDLVRGDELPSGVDYCVFDFGVNSGPGQAVKVLQRAINKVGDRSLNVDGLIGPSTIDAASSVPSTDLIHEICGERLSFLHRLKTFDVFGKGWSQRVADVEVSAKQMSLNAPVPLRKPDVPKELGPIDPPKDSKLPEIVTGVSGVASTGLLAVVNNPYALTFAVVVFAVAAAFLWKKYIK